MHCPTISQLPLSNMPNFQWTRRSEDASDLQNPDKNAGSLGLDPSFKDPINYEPKRALLAWPSRRVSRKEGAQNEGL